MGLEVLEGVPTDQLIALSCHAFTLVAAVTFYLMLSPRNSSSHTRHAVCALIGVTAVILTYGNESVHLFLMSLNGYILMHFLSPGHRGWATFATCVVHVLGVHLHTYIYHYMEFRVEVSNSLMPLAIKVSYTAFSLDDSQKEDKQLTPNQLKYKLKVPPTLFEYFCFCFCFLGALFGPSYHYKDYSNFIRGDQYSTKWPVKRAFIMILFSLVCLLTHFIVSDHFGPRYNLDPVVMSWPLLARHAILWLTMFFARCKYYFCWMSSEAICYLGGLGYDQHSEEKNWPSSTVKPLGIEFATSLKMFSDNWNIFITQWLHFCIYERVKQYKVLCVFIFSATWHGFYPGYYMMFMPLAAAILLGRKLRKTLRPVFQQSKSSQILYDVITWLATTTLIAFNSCAFELKVWDDIYTLQSSFYFWPHLAVALGLVLVQSGRNVKTDKHKENNNTDYTQHHQNGHSLHSG